MLPPASGTRFTRCCQELAGCCRWSVVYTGPRAIQAPHRIVILAVLLQSEARGYTPSAHGHSQEVLLLWPAWSLRSQLGPLKMGILALAQPSPVWKSLWLDAAQMGLHCPCACLCREWGHGVVGEEVDMGQQDGGMNVGYQGRG